MTLGLIALWLALVAGLGGWASQRTIATWQSNLAASARYEAETSARIVDRLFTEMASVANMVAQQSQVIQLATRYRTDPPGLADLTRQERATRFTQDPLVRKVGDFMNRLSMDLHYGRIYMNNLSDETVTASNWADDDSIVGMIYTRRAYLMDALRDGIGHSFGIARLLKLPSYFVASRIEDADGRPLGSVTVRFDVPDMALYLTGRHIALIVNRQGRVTTSSSEPFMLHNVAALLPADSLGPSEDEEGPGEPMDIHALTDQDQADEWLIDGTPYLLQRQALAHTQYQLLTLASLDERSALRQRHLWTALLVATVGLILILLSAHAISQILRRREAERYAAHHDSLTGLPNRRAVLKELDRLFALAQRSRQQVLVAFIDLDGFKTINDVYGHATGDQFLAEIARRLSTGLRAGDMLGRWGGDEFVMIGLAAPPDPDAPDAVTDAIRNRLAPLSIGTYAFADCHFDYPGASFGIVSVDPAHSSPQAALKEADQRMYADKEARRAQEAAASSSANGLTS